MISFINGLFHFESIKAAIEGRNRHVRIVRFCSAGNDPKRKNADNHNDPDTLNARRAFDDRPNRIHVVLMLALIHWRGRTLRETRALRAEIDEAAWTSLNNTTSRPFEKPQGRQDCYQGHQPLRR
jgi:hypothetical protein